MNTPGASASAYPFYYAVNGDPSDCVSLTNPQNESNFVLNFKDQPTNPDGLAMIFDTTLVGVLPPNTGDTGDIPDLLADVGDTFDWMSTFTGAGGNVNLVESLSIPTDPGDGTGGVTILSVGGVPVTPVPEPPGILILLPALGLLGFGIRKKTRVGDRA